LTTIGTARLSELTALKVRATTAQQRNEATSTQHHCLQLGKGKNMLADSAWCKKPRDKIDCTWAVNVASWGEAPRADPLQVELTLTRRDKKRPSYFRIILLEREAYQLLDVLTHRGIRP
jgi:hypothetical protein